MNSVQLAYAIFGNFGIIASISFAEKCKASYVVRSSVDMTRTINILTCKKGDPLAFSSKIASILQNFLSLTTMYIPEVYIDMYSLCIHHNIMCI